MDKQKILQPLFERQRIAIAELTRSMENYKEFADLDEDDTLDPEDFSQQTVAKESQLRLEQQLGRAKSDLELLEQFATNKFDRVQAGSLVLTDSVWFLAGISLGAMEIEGKTLHCISVDSPAFDTVLGKKVNDNFTLGSTPYLVKEIS